jgi:hypothetical protein
MLAIDITLLGVLRQVPNSEVWPTLTNSGDGTVFGVEYDDGCPAETVTFSTSTNEIGPSWGSGCGNTW